MTPDHTPYLRPGVDLITAEDAARWLDERDDAHEGAETLADALYALRARLDRERRQACRRGALAAWRLFRSWVHGWGYDPMEEGGEEAAECLAAALAFRAAASEVARHHPSRDRREGEMTCPVCTGPVDVARPVGRAIDGSTLPPTCSAECSRRRYRARFRAMEKGLPALAFVPPRPDVCVRCGARFEPNLRGRPRLHCPACPRRIRERKS